MSPSKPTKENSDTYEICVYSTLLFFPIWFAVHTHITIRHNNEVDRYDLFGHVPGSREQAIVGNIYKNVLSLEEGLFILFARHALSGLGPRWNTKKNSSVVGPSGSVAQEMYLYFKNEGFREYPFVNRYNMFLGPNSNTFIQWVVNKYPKSKLKLPINAWGKNYKNI